MAIEEPVQNLFSPQRLAEHAQRLALAQSASSFTTASRPIRPLLQESRDILLGAYSTLATAAQSGEEVTPGARWLLDNFYVIKEQVREIRKDLPRRYYSELPKLSTGVFKGLPRVYAIVHELAALVDNAVEELNLKNFVAAYQEVHLLSTGELWAVPALLRLVLLQNLHTLALQLQAFHKQQRSARAWTERIAWEGRTDAADVLLAVKSLAEEYPSLPDPFVVALADSLKAYGTVTVPVLDWLDHRLQARHMGLQEIIRLQAQRQTQRQVSIGNAITTLKWASQYDWPDFVEALSGVDRTLNRDPAGVYADMDFYTRDRYRHKIEDLARRTSMTEFDLAERTVALARHAAEAPKTDPVTHHVGYYLIGPGLERLEAEVGYRMPFGQRLLRFGYRHPSFAYLTPVVGITALAEAAALNFAVEQGASMQMLVLLALCSLLPFLDFAVTFTNRVLAHILPPRVLPKLEFENGIPQDHRTMVVVPTLLTSPENARDQVEHLEIHALANPDPALRFALLSDFTDAPAETMPDDEAILNAARTAIRSLNERYRDAWGDRFFLLHRDRRWNETQGSWMGWERKRGKLEEFNHLLRQPEAETTFTTLVGDFLSVTAGDAIRYVITLDADTKLPPDSAVDLVRTAAHPLNHPRFNPAARRVTQGYGVLQPRISISAASSARSLLARIFSGNVGIDPYTTAVSDIYQDLFGEGIYTGKGLYQVDAFLASLGGIVPENTVLSHDLLEGNHARVALVTDAELFDDYPSNYETLAKRQHRWVRGDWQILSWLFPLVRNPRGGWRRNPIRFSGKWKIFDNLRRSLTPLGLIVFLLAGWTFLPSPPILWTAVAVAVLAFPMYVNLTTALITRPHDVTLSSYFREVLSDLKSNSLQAALSLTFLAHQAVLMVDAIVRTLWRMLVSRKHLLEWTTAYQAEQTASKSPGGYVRFMIGSVIWGVGVLALTLVMEPIAWIVALPFAALWIAAPWIAWHVSRPLPERAYRLSAKDRRWLRRTARYTWRYFDHFLNPEHRWLPPDNFQEEPYRGLAPRTSPTNIGMGLLSVQAAYDLGYLTRRALINRLGESLGSIRLLDRYRGHFFNWYETPTGRVLHPQYLSTVDSGNLAGALIVLQQALLETPTAPWPNPALFDGMQDTVHAAQFALLRAGKVLREENGDVLEEALASLEKALPDSAPDTLNDWYAALHALRPLAQALADDAADVLPHEESDEIPVDVSGTLRSWCLQPLVDLDALQTELDGFAPWLATGTPVPESLIAPGSLQALQRALHEVLDASAFDQPDLLHPAEDAITTLCRRATTLAHWCRDLVQEMDFSLFYNKRRRLFTIGYNTETFQPDHGLYDLLASEARLASYIAIGKGDVPATHWFRLGRPLASLDRRKTLLSWSGTMFEYLMPLLLMRSYQHTLLGETYRNVVRWQQQYGRRKRLPWGVSESAYNALNLELDYQYQAFGVPGLGLKRGLSEDYVVAPYASALALMIEPDAALENLRALRREEAFGPYGYYEAIDYTKARLFADQERAVVCTYMAHHQGMMLVAILNVLNDFPMPERFHASPITQSVELLLQERIPRPMETIDPHPMETTVDPGERPPEPVPVEYLSRERLHDPVPHGYLLSNGRYTTLITNAGTGYSYFDQWAATRWEPDRTLDALGFYIYVRDLDSGAFWSAGYQPVQREPDRFDTWYHLSKVETARVDDWIETFVEVCVSPEDDVEVRRLTLTNYSDQPRRIELTSYAEVVINQLASDRAHPAFSKLFVRTEYVPQHHALLASRRPRSGDESPFWLFHAIADPSLDTKTGPLQFETDRTRFIGRGRTLAHPQTMDPGTQLSGTVGNVLDPIVSLRRIIRLGPKEKIHVTFSLGAATSREEAFRLTDRYDNPPAVQRAIELATVYGTVETGNLGITDQQAFYFQKLASALLFDHPALRASSDLLARNRKQQSGLWAYGISGDLPVLVARVSRMEELDLVRTLIKAHEYWTHRNLNADIVFLNDHPPSYVQELHEEIVRLIQASHTRGLGGRGGGLFLLRSDQMPPEDLVLIQTVAKAAFQGELPQLPPPAPPPPGPASDEPPPRRMIAAHRHIPSSEAPVPRANGAAATPTTDGQATRESLLFFNGYGGFTPDGQEYVIHSRGGKQRNWRTPLPWVNVVANEHFGFTATESGAGYTWSRNSRENRLTPWSNDPVTDPLGEALYVRDDAEGVFWSPTVQPIPQEVGYETRHGFGYTRYRHTSRNLAHEMTLFVPRHDPIKIIHLRLTNRSTKARRLSVFRFQEWVLGVLRSESSRYVVTRYDDATGSIFAQNWYNNEFAGRVAFAGVFAPTADHVGFTTDRTAFLGRNGSLARPAALGTNAGLDGRTGAGFDVCAAFRVPVKLEPNASVALYFFIGEADHEEAAQALIQTYQDEAAIQDAFETIRAFWQATLSRMQVHTPAPEMDVLLNGWLLYQDLCCRIWARSAFYQSGGAYGFRDQLQDVSALVYTLPSLTKEQILRHASHQFVEGDVLHWWHPPTGRGIRSRFSDDLLWLPYITTFYIQSTGDEAILDERAPYLTARLLEEGEDEAYLVPDTADIDGDLYDHCCRTIDRSLTKGDHGLPLMGSGDWNDGMNRVGNDGEGESVWLGFFLYTILKDFLPFCKKRGDEARVKRYRSYMKNLAKALNEAGWDGSWYRRAYYDDGTPLGSSESDECKIDAIAQGWSVMSGVAPRERAEQALAAVERYLVSEDDGLIRLLTPPFDQTPHDPGYIKGYPPGVRENGGQYTHGVLWAIRAFAEMGYGTRALELFNLINPVNHARSTEAADVYKVEPYVVTADVYSVEPHVGRGGWSWYTGSGGWMYRVGLESILGVTLSGGDTLVLDPRIPSSWSSYSVRYRLDDGETRFEIEIENPDGVEQGIAGLQIDGEAASAADGTARIPLVRDGRTHQVRITMGVHVPSSAE